MRGLLARDGKLVLDLELHVLRYAVLPELRAKLPRRLAFQDLHQGRADHLPIQVGEHEGALRVLQDGVDLAYLVARLLV